MTKGLSQERNTSGFEKADLEANGKEEQEAEKMNEGHNSGRQQTGNGRNISQARE